MSNVLKSSATLADDAGGTLRGREVEGVAVGGQELDERDPGSMSRKVYFPFKLVDSDRDRSLTEIIGKIL